MEKRHVRCDALPGRKQEMYWMSLNKASTTKESDITGNVSTRQTIQLIGSSSSPIGMASRIMPIQRSTLCQYLFREVVQSSSPLPPLCTRRCSGPRGLGFCHVRDPLLVISEAPTLSPMIQTAISGHPLGNTRSFTASAASAVVPLVKAEFFDGRNDYGLKV